MLLRQLGSLMGVFTTPLKTSQEEISATENKKRTARLCKRFARGLSGQKIAKYIEHGKDAQTQRKERLKDHEF